MWWCQRCAVDGTIPLGRRLRVRRSTLRAVYFGLALFAVFAYVSTDWGKPVRVLTEAAYGGAVSGALMLVMERAQVHLQHEPRRGQLLLRTVVLFAITVGAGLLLADLLLWVT